MIEIKAPSGGMRVSQSLTDAAELPADLAVSSEPLSRSPGPPEIRHLEIDFAQHIGGMVLNGLLGATWRQTGSDHLIIRVRFGDPKHTVLDSLASDWGEPVNAQLPKDWAMVILKAALKEESTNHLTSGLLEFSHVGLGEVGSTQGVICSLARSIIRLLHLPSNALDVAAIREHTPYDQILK